MPKKAHGVSPAVAQMVIQRDGMSCNVRAMHHGYAVPYTQLHHRHPRSMGGTRIEWVNQPANLLSICDACHAFVESFRELAAWHGWLVTGIRTAAETPCYIGGKWWLLDDAGQMVQTEAPLPM